MDGALQVFPLPILTFLLAGVAVVLVARLNLRLKLAHGLFVTFFVMIGLGALMVALRYGYGVQGLIPIQRALPLFAGPVLYLGFALFALPQERRTKAMVGHLGVAAVLAITPQIIFARPVGMDALIAVSYLVYTLLLLNLWHKGVNHLTHARIEQAEALRRWMLWAAGFLGAFFLADGAIAISFAFARTDSAMTLISVSSLVLIIVLVALIVAVKPMGDTAQPSPEGTPAPTEDDLEQRVRTLLNDTQLYLDTDLTVERLARRLHVPSRALSGAINTSTGMNVSSYVNGFRLAHAAGLLKESTLSVTKVMEQSGFLTRSNFYREFQKAYGQTPAAYRDSAKTP